MNKPEMKPTPQKELKSLTEHEASSLRQNPKQAARVFMAPMPGFTANPLLKFPRNSPCPCRSLRKFKACCLLKLPQAVSLADAEKYKTQMESPNLTFVTEENKETLKIAAEMREYFAEQERLEKEKPMSPELSAEAKETFEKARVAATERYKKDLQNAN